MSRKPLVSTADWELIYSDDDKQVSVPLQVRVYRDRNDDIFYKVLTYINFQHKTKYFYNETAHSDVPRFLVDQTGEMKYWRILD